MSKKIIRKRTHNPEHMVKEEARQKMMFYRECEQLMPIISNEAWVDINDPVILNDLIDPTPTPEAILISKEIFSFFSDEAKTLAQILLSCPEEFFLVNGRIKKELLRNECREVLGWSKRKTDITTNEIGSILQQH